MEDELVGYVEFRASEALHAATAAPPPGSEQAPSLHLRLRHPARAASHRMLADATTLRIEARVFAQTRAHQLAMHALTRANALYASAHASPAGVGAFPPCGWVRRVLGGDSTFLRREALAGGQHGGGRGGSAGGQVSPVATVLLRVGAVGLRAPSVPKDFCALVALFRRPASHPLSGEAGGEAGGGGGWLYVGRTEVVIKGRGGGGGTAAREGDKEGDEAVEFSQKLVLHYHEQRDPDPQLLLRLYHAPLHVLPLHADAPTAAAPLVVKREEGFSFLEAGRGGDRRMLQQVAARRRREQLAFEELARAEAGAGPGGVAPLPVRALPSDSFLIGQAMVRLSEAMHCPLGQQVAAGATLYRALHSDGGGARADAALQQAGTQLTIRAAGAQQITEAGLVLAPTSSSSSLLLSAGTVANMPELEQRERDRTSQPPGLEARQQAEELVRRDRERRSFQGGGGGEFGVEGDAVYLSISVDSLPPPGLAAASSGLGKRQALQAAALMPTVNPLVALFTTQEQEKSEGGELGGRGGAEWECVGRTEMKAGASACVFRRQLRLQTIDMYRPEGGWEKDGRILRLDVFDGVPAVHAAPTAPLPPTSSLLGSALVELDTLLVGLAKAGQAAREEGRASGMVRCGRRLRLRSGVKARMDALGRCGASLHVEVSRVPASLGSFGGGGGGEGRAVERSMTTQQFLRNQASCQQGGTIDASSGGESSSSRAGTGIQTGNGQARETAGQSPRVWDTAGGPTFRLVFNIACRGLPRATAGDACDPVAALFSKACQGESFSCIGQTEAVANDDQPTFHRTLQVDFQPQSLQPLPLLRLAVYDDSGEKAARGNLSLDTAALAFGGENAAASRHARLADLNLVDLPKEEALLGYAHVGLEALLDAVAKQKRDRQRVRKAQEQRLRQGMAVEGVKDTVFSFELPLRAPGTPPLATGGDALRATGGGGPSVQLFLREPALVVECPNNSPSSSPKQSPFKALPLPLEDIVSFTVAAKDLSRGCWDRKLVPEASDMCLALSRQLPAAPLSDSRLDDLDGDGVTDELPPQYTYVDRTEILACSVARRFAKRFLVALEPSTLKHQQRQQRSTSRLLLPPPATPPPNVFSLSLFVGPKVGTDPNNGLVISQGQNLPSHLNLHATAHFTADELLAVSGAGGLAVSLHSAGPGGKKVGELVLSVLSRTKHGPRRHVPGAGGRGDEAAAASDAGDAGLSARAANRYQRFGLPPRPQWGGKPVPRPSLDRRVAEGDRLGD